MQHVPQAGLTALAVAGPVERGVRPQFWTLSDRPLLFTQTEPKRAQATTAQALLMHGGSGRPIELPPQLFERGPQLCAAHGFQYPAGIRRFQHRASERRAATRWSGMSPMARTSEGDLLHLTA